MKRNVSILVALFVAIIFVVILLSRGGDEAVAEIFVKPFLGPFRVTVTTTGELQAKNSVEVKGPSNARIARIWEMKIQKLIPEGTVVDSGDFVAELDKSELESKIRDMELSIQESESRFEQVKLDCTLTLANARNELINLEFALEERLLAKEQARYEAPSVTRQAEIDYDKSVRSLKQAEDNYVTQVAKAEAQMKEAETELLINRKRMKDYLGLMEGFTIHAPKPGMLIYAREWNGSKKTEGSQVSGWDPVVATLPDLSVMESKTYVSEVDIQKIRGGQQVKISLDADPDKTLSGEVSSVANIGEQLANSDSKVFEVLILIHESDSTLRPAMTTSNEILVNEVDSALSLPLEAVHSSDSLSYVYRKRDGGLIRQEVALGLINETHAQILDGVRGDDRVLLSLPADEENIPEKFLER